MQANALTIIHKALRADLFDLSSRLSNAGPADAEAVRTALEAVAGALRGHGEREDQNLIPLLAARSPELAGAMARDHHRLDAQLVALCDAARVLVDLDLEQRAERLARLYLDWNQFVSAYLAHLDDEERTFFAPVADALPPVESVAEGAIAGGPAFLQRLGQLVTPDERSRIEDAYQKLAG